MLRRIRATLALTLLVFAWPIQAQTVFDSKYYSVSISGFPIGHVEYDAERGDGRYQVQGFLGSSGFLGFFISTRYSGAVIGQATQTGVVPDRFRGRFEARGGFAQVDIEYRDGEPASVARLPEREALSTDVSLQDARGALDPISAIYAMLRDRPRSRVCAFDERVFDGTRLSRVTLGAPKEIEGLIQCNGVYARQGGFSPELAEDPTEYPFLLEYGQANSGLWRVVGFLAATDFGVARAQLRSR